MRTDRGPRTATAVSGPRSAKGSGRPGRPGRSAAASLGIRRPGEPGRCTGDLDAALAASRDRLRAVHPHEDPPDVAG
jgi:hypothetical protein